MAAFVRHSFTAVVKAMAVKERRRSVSTVASAKIDTSPLIRNPQSRNQQQKKAPTFVDA